MKEETYRVVKVVIAIAVIIVLYLFALGGRYEVGGPSNTVVFDKWKESWGMYDINKFSR